MSIVAYDPSIHRLGKHAPQYDPRTLLFAKYLKALPPVPTKRAWSGSASPNWEMMLNDKLGDCTCAGLGHGIQVWTAANGNELTIPDSEVLRVYEGACGYDPKDPGTDRGGNEIAVLNWFRKNPIGGVKLAAYAALEPKNHKHVEAAIDLFGFAYLGLALPATAQKQIGGVWSVVPHAGADAKPGSWGGHAVVAPDYDDSTGLYTCITWGGPQDMTRQFFETYVEEAYALFSDAWAPLDSTKLAPSGFDYAELQADLAAL